MIGIWFREEGGYMREIKFRAWLPEGAWSDDGETCEHRMLYGDELAFEEYAPINDQLASCPTLEQYTGMKDKNGREIYEGDILQRPDGEGRSGLVQFALGLFGVNWDYKITIDPCYQDGVIYGAWGNKTNLRVLYDGFVDELVVIGNIHENPELLG
jgi:uncharacterized phage protein (TIGR01671 family)